jgi:hypothetical protein
VEELAHHLQCGLRASTWWRHGRHSGGGLPVCSSCSDPRGCVGTVGIHPTRSSRPRTRSSLLLDHMLSGRRGACNGSNVHHDGENSNVKSKNPLPSAPNVEVICDTSLGTTARVTRRGFLTRGNLPKRVCLFLPSIQPFIVLERTVTL